MRMRHLAAMVLGVAVATKGGLAQSQELGEETRIRLAELLRRSTVTVATGPGTVGSGFVAGPGVQVVTNLHVVAGSPNVELRFSDGQSVPGTVVATDPEWDLALLEPLAAVDSPPPALRLADSDRARVGQSVLAMGAPFGLQGTLTLGILSARRALPLPTGGVMRDVLQTDAAINPGNSGGPLVDARGRVIGVSTAIFSRSGGNQGIGFAVPSNAARRFLDATRARRAAEATRPWLGLGGTTFRDARVHGVLVTSVARGGPAEAAGLDQTACSPNQPLVVWAVDDRPVRSPEELDAAVRDLPAGERVTLSLYCTGGAFREWMVVVAPRHGPTKLQ